MSRCHYGSDSDDAEGFYGFDKCDHTLRNGKRTIFSLKNVNLLIFTLQKWYIHFTRNQQTEIFGASFF